MSGQKFILVEVLKILQGESEVTFFLIQNYVAHNNMLRSTM